MLPPSGMLLLAGGGEPLPPMQRCLVVDGWMLALAGVRLPLWLLDRLEQRVRRSAAGGRLDLAAPSEPWAPLQLYVLSCWAFWGSCSLQMVLPMLPVKVAAAATQPPPPFSAPL